MMTPEIKNRLLNCNNTIKSLKNDIEILEKQLKGKKNHLAFVNEIKIVLEKLVNGENNS